MMSDIVIRLKSYIWHLDRMVGMILCFSVVARMNMAWAGGYSRFLRNAFKDCCDSMCTSSTMNTL